MDTRNGFYIFDDVQSGKEDGSSYLTQVVKVILPVDPSIPWIGYAVGFGSNESNISSFTVKKLSFEQLQNIRNIFNGNGKKKKVRRK